MKDSQECLVIKRKSVSLWSSFVSRWLKDPALSLQWLRSLPWHRLELWPRNFPCCRHGQKKKVYFTLNSILTCFLNNGSISLFLSLHPFLVSFSVLGLWYQVCPHPEAQLWPNIGNTFLLVVLLIPPLVPDLLVFRVPDHLIISSELVLGAPRPIPLDWRPPGTVSQFRSQTLSRPSSRAAGEVVSVTTPSSQQVLIFVFYNPTSWTACFLFPLKSFFEHSCLLLILLSTVRIF